MGYICGNGEDLEVCMITGSRVGRARGREEDSKDTWKKRWKVTLSTLGFVDGGKAGGAAKWKRGHSERQEVNPPQVLCQCCRGGARPAHWHSRQHVPPHASEWSPLKRLCEWWRWEGCRWQLKHRAKKPHKRTQWTLILKYWCRW